MIKVGEVLISDDIRDKEFVCNLEKCKGACCVEGDFGAPLEESELQILEEIYPIVKPYLSPKAIKTAVKPYLTAKGIKTIEKQGTHTIDDDGELCTPVIDGKECVYSSYDKKGILKCGIEQAYNDGKVSWKKPISCHLYPIRVTSKKNFEALNYHKWHICSPACALGKELQVPVYKFLKDPLIRKYGAEWYGQLEKAIEKQPKK